MRNDIFTMTMHTEYLVTAPQGQILGTFTTWEGAQTGAQWMTELSSTGEVYIMRGTDTLEIVQEGQEVLPLKIAGGNCDSCNTETDVVSLGHVDICEFCSGECGEGEHIWNYLQG